MRPIVWFSHDVVSPGRGRKLPAAPTPELGGVPRVVRDALAFMKPEDTKGVGSVQIFSPGCVYTFNEFPAPRLGVVNNGECIGAAPR